MLCQIYVTVNEGEERNHDLRVLDKDTSVIVVVSKDTMIKMGGTHIKKWGAKNMKRGCEGKYMRWRRLRKKAQNGAEWKKTKAIEEEISNS